MSIEAAGSPAQPLPIVNQTFEPAWVRNGSAATKQAYAEAQDFEQMLVSQLSQSLTQASGMDEAQGEGEEGQPGVPGAAPMSSELSTLLPQALSNGILEGGGLGLAAQIARGLEPAGAATTAPSAGEESSGPTTDAPVDAGGGTRS